MHPLIAPLLLAFSMNALAFPVSHYLITGTIRDDANSTLAAQQLSSLAVGDAFQILMEVEKLDANFYRIELDGALGGQAVLPQFSEGFYYGNDGGLGGLGINSWGIDSLASADGESIEGAQLGLALRGQELFYSGAPMPSQLRLVDGDGLIQSQNFVEGHLFLSFLSPSNGEFSLSGIVDGITAVSVPESGPGTTLPLAILALGLCRYVQRRSASPQLR